MATNKINVLIVEDDPDSAEAMAETLRLYAISTMSVPDARQALDIIAHLQPDVVLIDLQLDDQMNGLDLFKEIHADSGTQHIPAVAVSAYMREEIALDLYRAGFAACLAKPFDHYSIVNLVRQLAGSK